MERVGVHQFVVKDGENCYDLFGAKTRFRSLCSALVKNVVSKEEKWFSFCTRVDNSQVDIMSIKNDKGIKFGDFIKDVYYESMYRTAIYKYLLHEFLCYYESPIVQKDFNSYGYKNSFNKYLITSNINVVALWLGISLEEANKQYGNYLYGVDNDEEGDLFPYLKLYETKSHERKVTRPRKHLDLSVSGTRIVPLFSLKTGVDVLYDKLLLGTYDVMFCKDSGQKRTINTTFNIDKIRGIYTSSSYINGGIESWYMGNFIENPALERGYIRVFEVGASIYDNPLRSINYARIVSFKEAEPDLAYINIDLESVLDTFINGIYSCKDLDIAEFIEMLEVFEVGTSRKFNNSTITSREGLESWVNGQYVLLSTVFLRQLALFMLGNPQWFEGYTGAPKHSYESMAVDVEDDFGELDLG